MVDFSAASLLLKFCGLRSGGVDGLAGNWLVVTDSLPWVCEDGLVSKNFLIFLGKMVKDWENVWYNRRIQMGGGWVRVREREIKDWRINK